MKSVLARRLALWVGVAVCALYLVLFAAVTAALHVNGYALEHFTTGDSGDEYEYVALAKTMLASGHFALSPGSSAEVFRTPGYPAFLAPFLALFGTPVAVALFQILLVALSSALVFLLGERFFSRTVGFIAAALFALDPTTIVHTFITYSDTLFTTLVLAVAAFLLLPERLTYRLALCAGALAGFATLVRPIGLYAFPVLFVLALAVRKMQWRDAFAAAVLVAAAAAVFILPWMARNEFVAGHFSLSSVGTYNLLFYNAVEFEHAVTGETKSDVVEGFEKAIGTGDQAALKSFAYAPQESALIRKTLITQLPAYAAFHLYKTIPFYLSSSIEATELILYQKGALSGVPLPAKNITGLILKGDIRGAFSALAENAPAFVERFFWLVLALSGALYALFAALRHKPEWRFAALCVLIVACFAVLTGPVSFPRYRLPAEAFLFLAGAQGFAYFFAFAKRGTEGMMRRIIGI